MLQVSPAVEPGAKAPESFRYFGVFMTRFKGMLHLRHFLFLSLNSCEHFQQFPSPQFTWFAIMNNHRLLFPVK